VQLVIFGGVFMMVQVQNRNSTRDVDVHLLNIPSMTDAPLARETKKFQTALQVVAKVHRIKKTWLNDDGSMFYTGFAPNAQAHLWKRFNKLEVYLPEMDVILVLKLMGYRRKDQKDIAALCRRLGVHTRKQAQSLINDYVSGRWQTEYMVEKTLIELFEE
jgi:hypothetical protein